MYKVSKLLSDNNIKHWLDCGTLLHGYRNKAINNPEVIPKGICSSDNKLNDVDFDIGVLYTDYNKIREVFRSANIECAIELKNYVLRLHETMRLTDVPNRQKYGMWIDLYCWHEMSDTKKLTNTVFDVHGPDNPVGLSKYFIQELDEMELSGYKFPVPRYTEKFLQLRYGDTWQTPMTKEYYEKQYTAINKTLFQEDKVTVYIDGIWDLFHRGHVELFKRAHNMYDKVVVGVCSDDWGSVKPYKNKPIIPYDDRVEILKSCRYVDEVHVNGTHTPCVEFLDKNNFHYLLHAVKDFTNWKSEMTSLYHKNIISIINADRFHYLSYTNYHTTDIINMVLKKYT